MTFYNNLAILKKSALPIYRKYFNPFERRNLGRFVNLIFIILLEFFNLLILPTFYQSTSNLDKAILGEKSEFLRIGFFFAISKLLIESSCFFQNLLRDSTIESLKNEISKDSMECIKSGAITTFGVKDKSKHDVQSIVFDDSHTTSLNAVYKPTNIIFSFIRILYVAVFFLAQLNPRDNLSSRIPATLSILIAPICAFIAGISSNFLSQYIGGYLTKFDRERRDAKRKVKSSITFALENANDIAVRRGENFERDNINSKIDDLSKIEKIYRIIYNFRTPISVISSSINLITSYILLRFFSYEQPSKTTNVAEVALINSNLTIFSQSLSYFFGSETKYIERMNDAASRIDDLNRDIQNSKTSRNISQTTGANKFAIKKLEFIMGERRTRLHEFPSFNKGDIIRIYGPCGTGKSTLIHCITGIYKEINSMNIELPIDDAEKIEHLTKEPLKIREGFSLFQQIIYPKKLENLLPGERQEIDEEILDLVRAFIPNFNFTNRIHETINWNIYLSDGQKQICAIISAIIKKPELLLLDEAMCSLDKETKFKIQEYLKNIPNLTIFFVDHSPLLGDRKFETETINLADHLQFSPRKIQQIER